MRKFIVIIYLVIGCNSYALTPAERKIVEHANEYLQRAKDDAHRQQKLMEDADLRAQQAETSAALADEHARQTDSEIDKTKAQIDVSHKNEQALSLAVQKYKPFWDSGHKYWGLGAIGLGIGILLKHLFILAAVLLGLAVVGFIIYLVVSATPIGVGLTLAWSFLSSVLSKLGSIFKKK